MLIHTEHLIFTYAIAILSGSSPAQASVAPIAPEKEDSRLFCVKDKKANSSTDIRLKEPVVRLNRLSEEVNIYSKTLF